MDLHQLNSYRFRNINSRNRLLTKEHIDRIFAKFGIKAEINDLSLYQVAFVHSTYVQPEEEQLKSEEPITLEEYAVEVKNYPELEWDQYRAAERAGDWVEFQPDNYERLEILGDSVLGSIITSYIFHRYPNEREGFITKLKTQLVRGTNLCILAKKIKFDRYALLSRKSESLGLRQNDAILEDILEAFIGALYLDFGGHEDPGPAFGICYQFVITLMERYLNMNQMVRRKNNYKDQLMQYFHKHFFGDNPRYKLISTYGPTNDRTFKAGVINTDGDVITTGEGTKLVFAEQAAAKEALKYYGQEVYSDTEEADHQLYHDSDSESL